jgi:hypothetical protein
MRDSLTKDRIVLVGRRSLSALCGGIGARAKDRSRLRAINIPSLTDERVNHRRQHDGSVTSFLSHESFQQAFAFELASKAVDIGARDRRESYLLRVLIKFDLNARPVFDSELRTH